MLERQLFGRRQLQRFVKHHALHLHHHEGSALQQYTFGKPKSCRGRLNHCTDFTDVWRGERHGSQWYRHFLFWRQGAWYRFSPPDLCQLRIIERRSQRQQFAARHGLRHRYVQRRCRLQSGHFVSRQRSGGGTLQPLRQRQPKFRQSLFFKRWANVF